MQITSKPKVGQYDILAKLWENSGALCHIHPIIRSPRHTNATRIYLMIAILERVVTRNYVPNRQTGRLYRREDGIFVHIANKWVRSFRYIRKMYARVYTSYVLYQIDCDLKTNVTFATHASRLPAPYGNVSKKRTKRPKRETIAHVGRAVLLRI